MYAGSTLHYREIMESFRTEDFNVKNGSCNRIGFMGNGFTMREDSGGDLAFYMKWNQCLPKSREKSHLHS